MAKRRLVKQRGNDDRKTQDMGVAFPIRVLVSRLARFMVDDDRPALVMMMDDIHAHRSRGMGEIVSRPGRGGRREKQRRRQESKGCSP